MPSTPLDLDELMCVKLSSNAEHILCSEKVKIKTMPFNILLILLMKAVLGKGSIPCLEQVASPSQE